MKQSWSQLFGTCSYTPDEPQPQPGYPCPSNDLRKLYDFRNNLFNYIKQNICDSPYNTSCKRIGSMKYSSDIDVGISPNDDGFNSELWKLGSLISIKTFLVEFFKKDIDTISRFFDMNFYLSGYALQKDTTYLKIDEAQPLHGQTKNLNLNSCIISTSQNQTKYAFYDIVYTLHHDKKKPVVNTEDYMALVSHIGRLKHEYIIEDNINPEQIQRSGDAIIDAISQLSTAEDETYHTQGAYFHVVLQMQLNYTIDYKDSVNEMATLLKNSFVENLCFAYTHYDKGKAKKYLDRVADAWSRIEDMLEANKNFENPNWVPVFLQLYTEIGSYLNNKVFLLNQITTTLFQAMQREFNGGRNSYKRTSVKKKINGMGERVVYIDASRKQYIKIKGAFVRLTEVRKGIKR